MSARRAGRGRPRRAPATSASMTGTPRVREHAARRSICPTRCRRSARRAQALSHAECYLSGGLAAMATGGIARSHRRRRSSPRRATPRACRRRAPRDRHRRPLQRRQVDAAQSPGRAQGRWRARRRRRAGRAGWCSSRWRWRRAGADAGRRAAAWSTCPATATPRCRAPNAKSWQPLIEGYTRGAADAGAVRHPGRRPPRHRGRGAPALRMAGHRDVPAQIVFTKVDKLSASERGAAARTRARFVRHSGPRSAAPLMVSGESGEGRARAVVGDL